MTKQRNPPSFQRKLESSTAHRKQSRQFIEKTQLNFMLKGRPNVENSSSQDFDI